MSAFAARFGRDPEVSAAAPGRINVIGEHTDYNGGFVLPTALPLHATVALARRDDRRVRAASANLDGEMATYELGAEARGRGWLDYLQGVTAGLADRGHALGGFDLWLDSRVPMGSGLSSSAAMDVASLRGLREAFALALDDLEIARIAQQAERTFAGAHVGIMDPMAASLANEGAALFIDTLSLDHRHVPFPGGMEWIVVDSGVPHRLADGAYNQRRAECEEAARRLGVTMLRELTPDDLPRVARLPAPLDRRARHVVTEDARVLAAVAALERGDVPGLGVLLDASHESLRRDYEVSIPELDRLVARARTLPHVFGARMTGGGFGGAVIVLARAGSASTIAPRLVAGLTDPAPTVLVPPRAGLAAEPGRGAFAR